MKSNSESVSHPNAYIPGYSCPALIWLFLGILFYIFWRDIYGGIFILILGLEWLYWGIGLIILVLTVAEIWRQTKIRGIPRNGVAVIVFVILSGFILYYLGPHYGFLARFYLFKPRYEEIAWKLSQNFPSEYDTWYYDKLNGAIVDKGPPIRVAINLPGGLLDNFQAVVYDSSGEVGNLLQFKADPHWDNLEFNYLRKLFGGDIIYCEPIEKFWFYCWFT
jgi:hypothetical protein